MKIIFAGTPEFAAASLEAVVTSGMEICAVYTQPDRPAGRGRKLTPSPVKRLALKHGFDVMQPSTLKDTQVQQQLRELGADVMVVAAYGLLLPQDVLDIPSLGCINVHASLLPRWRGAAPIQRAILAGDSQTGITIMQMDKGLDTGDMLFKSSTPIYLDDNAQTLHDRLATLGARSLVDTLKLLEEGSILSEKQDDSLSCYAPKLEKSEARINWNEPADLINRRVRAYNPWPVAYTTLNDENLRIWAAQVVNQSQDSVPGTVIEESKEGIDISTGSGVLRVTQLQLPGKRPMSAAEFINAHSLAGQCLC